MLDEFQIKLLEPSYWPKWELHLEEVVNNSGYCYKLLLPDGKILNGEDIVKNGSFKFIIFMKGSFNPIHNGHVNLFTSSINAFSSCFGALSLSFETSKKTLSTQEVAFRSLLIHKSGFPVFVSKSGTFLNDVLYFKEIAKDIKLVFPVGIDALISLIEYYSTTEFNNFFSDSIFVYMNRRGYGGKLAIAHQVFDNIVYLGNNKYFALSSTLINELMLNNNFKSVQKFLPKEALRIFLKQ